jgi:ribonuclease HI
MLGTMLLNEERSRKYMVGADNQAAILTTRKERQMSGKYLVYALHGQIEGVTVTQRGARVIMKWTPAHKGTKGNERADEEAKRAARGEINEERFILIECKAFCP